MKIEKITSQLDRFGMTASTLCAVHCALLPSLITFLPLVGLGFLQHEWVEVLMICISVALGVLSLSSSYFKTHRSAVPLYILAFGFILIFAGHSYESHVLERLLSPLGGMFIVLAHYTNWSKNGACKHQSAK